MNTSWEVPSKQTKCLKPLTPTGNLKEIGTGDSQCSWPVNHREVWPTESQRGGEPRRAAVSA